LIRQANLFFNTKSHCLEWNEEEKEEKEGGENSMLIILLWL
jgi:hypothetical protein